MREVIGYKLIFLSHYCNQCNTFVWVSKDTTEYLRSPFNLFILSVNTHNGFEVFNEVDQGNYPKELSAQNSLHEADWVIGNIDFQRGNMCDITNIAIAPMSESVQMSPNEFSFNIGDPKTKQVVTIRCNNMIGIVGDTININNLPSNEVVL